MSDDTFVIVIEGISHLTQIDKQIPNIAKSARIAINHAATKGRTWMAAEILKDIAFPKSYVQPAQKRLHIKNKASDTDLEATIAAATRRTSLTRFMPGGVTYRKGKQPTSLMVKVGATSAPGKFEGAFIFKLTGAQPGTDTKGGNYGFAVRTKNGKPPPGAYKPTQLGKNLYLLYGPSVAQVLHSDRNNGGVASELSPKILAELEHEFNRQMGR